MLCLLVLADGNLRLQIPKAVCTCNLTIPVVRRGWGSGREGLTGQSKHRRVVGPEHPSTRMKQAKVVQVVGVALVL